ncbi:MAG: hypothetical protein KME45_27280 [Stenomitos rutilans HA7619-LM2]|jgi:hypothetical protein|nr:hypothetical protein [Stenomitos rutilans HA7619-LM2]
MTPDFESMSKAELRAYVLENREDLEAVRSLMRRRSPNAVRYDFSDAEEGQAQMTEILRRKINGEL